MWSQAENAKLPFEETLNVIGYDDKEGLHKPVPGKALLPTLEQKSADLETLPTYRPGSMFYAHK